MAADYSVGAFRKSGISKPRGSLQTPNSAYGLGASRSQLLYDRNISKEKSGI